MVHQIKKHKKEPRCSELDGKVDYLLLEVSLSLSVYTLRHEYINDFTEAELTNPSKGKRARMHF